MGVVSKLTEGIDLPKMIKIRQNFKKEYIPKEKIFEVVNEQLSREEIKSLIKPGMSIAITCGSRGIANIDIIIKSIVDFVKSCEGEPFVIPAMGSHGGATAEGQKDILTDFGVTEEYLDCPVISSMKTKQIGYTEEKHPVLIDKNAAEADGIIVCGRIKAHTAFEGSYESGLMKMMTIGLGKQQGAEVTHEAGFGEMAHLVPLFGNAIRKNANVVCGLGIIENAFDQIYKLISLTNEEIPEKEPELLLEAKELMGRILIDSTDVLVVDKIGKNCSGDGMDPNVSGRFGTPYKTGGINAERVVVLDLTDETHGNANGIGMADITTKRLVDKADLEMSYPNAITSTLLDMVKIPLYLKTDLEAIRLGLKTCNHADKKEPRIIRIQNTMQLENIYISEGMIEEAKQNPNVEIVGELESWSFDENGNLW